MIDKYINNWLVTYVFDNPITGNRIGDEGAKHLKLPANLQSLNLNGKLWLYLYSKYSQSMIIDD